jgi:L,D-transpeptidase YbiS
VARSLDQRAREISDLNAQIRANSQESEFLNKLPNFLPQDRGFLRTQHVISEEVAALRRQVGQRLRGSLHVVVDAKANKLYLKKGLKLLWEADCSVGRGGLLVDKQTGRRWEFVTPRGEFRVIGKAENPEWVKPDWAFVEAKEPVPPPEDPSRKVPGELGAYVLNLGDGYLIHGTLHEELLGRPASHGCVRLSAVDLKKLYETVPVGTKVYIY